MKWTTFLEHPIAKADLGALLILDCGHTRTKFHSFMGDEVERFIETNQPFHWPDHVDLKAYDECLLMGTNEPMSIRWLSHIKQAGGPVPMVLGKDVRVPLRVKSGPGTGNDRMVHALGARDLFPGESVLIVSGGSALVVDYVNSKGELVGGSIGMGWNYYKNCMHKLNKNLIPTEEDVTYPGYNTEHAVALGWKSMVQAMVEKLLIQYEGARLVLTGGDGEMMLSWWSKASYEPNLGINEMAKALGYAKKLS